MISSNTLLFNKKHSVYYREKHHSLSLPSPPPSPHESALKGLFGISEVLPKFDAINNTLLNSQQNETSNTFFPSIKCLLDTPIDHLDNSRKTESINKTTPSHCLSRFSLSNAKNPYLPQASSISSSLITPKIEDPINSPKFSFTQSQPTLEPKSYEFLPEKDTEFKTQELNVQKLNTQELHAAQKLNTQELHAAQKLNALPIYQLSTKRQQRPRSIQTKRSGTSAPQRKRKGNSLARVMADQGLLESVFNTNITSNDIKSVRIPPPLPMQFDELMSNINALDLDTDALEKISPEISWKGQPLSIAHLPHYNALHPTEARIVSVLRLTPIQYLTGKHTLISAAHRYAQKALPFKKSDAQKLLRIDVNKASKLWEFFHQVHWI
ncbi:18229_t:CDS:2 [Racocetra fulgida]|uniref:18229_t:CDS:1 n=2 Tax=Racocetra TaxID=940663 RepID=A0A9N9F6A2_9GLOM|nr:18229_t:CDS:2 [Racocetra fulgida]